LSYVSSPANEPLICETIGQRLEFAAEKFENREAFVFDQTGERLTFAQLKKKAEELATGLLAIGINKGGRFNFIRRLSISKILTKNIKKR
jgi:fatty-acyl-CoA synthase